MYGAARLNDMRDCMHMQFAVYTVYGLNMYYKVTIQVKYKKKSKRINGHQKLTLGLWQQTITLKNTTHVQIFYFKTA